ncbi:MAG: LysO family transporter [Desulfovibrionaceae bacterium]|nr:LysO family transporter [Desulfovibrionaceae bacterium]
MLLEMGLIAAGIPAGYVLRRKERARAVAARLLTRAVWALLFVLGLAVGSDSMLLEQLSRLGVRAAVISALSVAGCLVAARLAALWLNLDAGTPSDAESSAGPSAHRGPSA